MTFIVVLGILIAIVVVCALIALIARDPVENGKLSRTNVRERGPSRMMSLTSIWR